MHLALQCNLPAASLTKKSIEKPQTLSFNKKDLVSEHATGCLAKLFPSSAQAKSWLTWILH